MFLSSIVALATLVGLDVYGDFETEAQKRLGARHPEDWPILAAALALGCPIWTEDTDFFRLWRRNLDVQQPSPAWREFSCFPRGIDAFYFAHFFAHPVSKWVAIPVTVALPPRARGVARYTLSTRKRAACGARSQRVATLHPLPEAQISGAVNRRVVGSSPT